MFREIRGVADHAVFQNTRGLTAGGSAARAAADRVPLQPRVRRTTESLTGPDVLTKDDAYTIDIVQTKLLECHMAGW